MSGKVRLGIIGLGAQGSMYAKFIADWAGPQHGDRRNRRHQREKRDAAAQEYDVPVYAGLPVAAGER